MLAPTRAERIAELKAELDGLRPLAESALTRLRHVYDVELTYTSNAIEGNTLTAQETALVIEKGITIGGKLLAEHLEAQDHYAAVQCMRELAATVLPLGVKDVVELHRRIVLRSHPDIAGVNATTPRRIAGTQVIFPNAARIPDHMRDFGTWLAASTADPDAAFQAHLQLVTIHPFSDGNGRTARLLMNMLLIRGGYPPIAIRPADRRAYLAAIEQAQLGAGDQSYFDLLGQRLQETLTAYIAICQEPGPLDAGHSTGS